MATLFEVWRFAIRSSSSNIGKFKGLRDRVAGLGRARSQYYGNLVTDGNVEEDQFCWFIEWTEPSSLFRSSAQFRTDFEDLAADCPRSLLLRFYETRPGEVHNALISPVCEMAYISLPPNAPRHTAAFELSLHKTFTDCYLAPEGGMTGGGWGYALNSNDSAGERLTSRSLTERMINEADRMLAYYVIGWTNKEAHRAYGQTELFREEIDRLLPYYGPGTGSYWVIFQQHT